MFNNFNRNVSIKNRIYLGFGISLCVFLVASLLSIVSLNRTNENFTTLNSYNKRLISDIKLDKDISELKRNVSIYTYTGHENVIDNVNQLTSQIAKDLSYLKATGTDKKEGQFYTRMEDHLKTYAETFRDAVREFEIKERLINKEIFINIKRLKKTTYGYKVIELENNILSYFKKPSSSAALIINSEINELEGYANTKKDLRDLDNIKRVFLRTSQAMRNYLYLVNVVMAGEAYEFSYVSNELKNYSILRVNKLNSSIQRQNKKIQLFTLIILLVLLAFTLGFSLLVSSGISKPLLEITDTLRSISKGSTDVSIPGQDRKDEIGVLSKAAEVFREKSHRLEESNDELSQFAYRTSHDLKAPLISIIGMSDIIKEDLDDGDYDEVKINILKIKSSARKLEALISDILNLSKADHLESLEDDCKIIDVIQSIESKLEQMITEKKIIITYDDLKVKSILTQKIRFEQIIENIVSNAIKYSDPNKEKSFIDISTGHKGDNIFIEVTDNGLGIKDENQKDLFVMFKRFHAGSAFGSGLGLYLVKKHIEKLKGRIEVKSSEGISTTFSIYLKKPV